LIDVEESLLMCVQFDLGGHVALVTGSSRSIGRSLADGLAAAGANVVLNGVDRPAST
jgi:gluconate 5-dehydrogenase